MASPSEVALIWLKIYQHFLADVVDRSDDLHHITGP